MQVIMLKDVGGVGRRGTVVEVSDGFALNSLIPRGAAVQATPARLAEHAAQQKRENAASAAREQSFAEIAKKIDGTTVTLAARANPTGGLFNQIHPDAIIEALSRKHGVAIPPDAIVLDAPVKTVGTHSARLKLGKVESKFAVQIVPAE